MNKRNDLRLIISSATLNAEDFRAFFEDSPKAMDKTRENPVEQKSSDKCVILSVEGRQFPVGMMSLCLD